MLSRYHAINIQRFWRGFLSRSDFSRNSMSAVLVQSHVRRYLTQLAVGDNLSHVVDDIEALETCTERVSLVDSNTLHEDVFTVKNHEEATSLKKSTSINPQGNQAVDYASFQTRENFVDSVHRTEVEELENDFNSQHQLRFDHHDTKTKNSFQDDFVTTLGLDQVQRTISFFAHNEADLSKENQPPEVHQQNNHIIPRFAKANNDQTELSLHHKPQTLRYSSPKTGPTQPTRSPIPTPPLVSSKAKSSSSLRGILRNGPNHVPSSTTHSTSTTPTHVRNIDVNKFAPNVKKSPLQHKSVASPEKDEDIQSIGVQTRSKRSIFRSLNAARPIESENISREHVSAHDSLPNLLTRTASPDLKSTIKALQIVEKSRLMSELKEAMHNLERTTRSSKECCKYFVKVKGQILLSLLITSCNRSTPHLELIQVVLQTMTNVAMHRSTAHQLATNEVVEVIIYVCQMYRDKAKLLALSCSLLDKVMMDGDHAIMVS
jgi:hypothetical protein